MKKNPFLEDRKLISTATSSAVPQQRTSTTNTYRNSIQSDNKNIFNGKPLRQQPSSSSYYQKYQQTQQQKGAFEQFTNHQDNRPSQKITFGDPSSSSAAENYTGYSYGNPRISSSANNNEKTSGYFNVKNSGASFGGTISGNGGNSIKESQATVFRNNYLQQPQQSKHQRQQQQEGAYESSYGYNRNKYKDSFNDHEFAPPPINTFNNSKLGTYDKHEDEMKYAQHTYQKSRRNDDAIKQGYTSPPKQGKSSINNGNTGYQSFGKPMRACDMSPIGEVSKHGINEDSLLNLDGLASDQDLDRLLADSRTQEELIRILGMDISSMHRNPSFPAVIPADIAANQPRFGSSDDHEPKVFDYCDQPPAYQFQSGRQQHKNAKNVYNKDNDDIYSKESYSKNNYARNTYDTNNNPALNKYENRNVQVTENEKNQRLLDRKNQKQQQQSLSYPINSRKVNSLDQGSQGSAEQNQQEGLEQKIRRQMRRLSVTRTRSGAHRRVFMTATEKISTVNYQLRPL